MNRNVVVAALFASITAGPAAAFSLVLDPGHGGADPGAVGCGLEEHDLNLDIGLKLQGLLEDSGQTVFMTRTTNVSVALAGRSDFANSHAVDRFVSLHNNAFNGAATGTETFCFATVAGRDDFDQATKIQAEVVATFGLANRGVKDGSSLSVIRNTTMPATLSELGFLDNCSVDATILAQDARRTDGAEAHLAALAAHLGFDINGNPTPQNGDLKGVVFADDGSGIGNVANLPRIGGATVSIVGRAETATAAVDTASWSISLPAGTYRVRASAPGFITNERDCDPLDAAGVRFCSIGLFAEGSGGEGEGDIVVGEGEGDIVVGEGEGDVAEGEGDIAEGEGDGFEGEGDSGLVVIRNKPNASGGCQGCAAVDGPTSLLALAGLALLRRRKNLMLLTMLVFSTTQALAAPMAASTTTNPTTITPTSALQTLLSQERVVKTGIISSVQPSPSGQQLLVSDDHYDGLSVIDVATGAQTVLSTSTRAGFRALWASERQVAHRVPTDPFGGQPLILLDVKDGSFVGPFVEHPTLAVVQSKGDVITIGTRLDDAGHLKDARVLSPKSDQCFAPILRTQGAHVVVAFQCLQSGMWLVRDNEVFALGQGAQPAFSEDGERLVYVVTADEGHVITASDVVIVDTTTAKPQATRVSTPRIERAPGISNRRSDGSRVVAFVVDPAASANGKGAGPGELVTAIVR